MDFKEFEKQQAGKPAEVTQEAQEVKEVQEPLTPEEIDQAGEELHRAALRVAKIINPDANERDAHNFAHTPFFSDHLDYMENPGGLRPEYKELAANLKQRTQEAQEVLSKWEAIKKRFYQSEQWKKLQENFKDITPEQVEILLDTPAFLWQVVEMLPEILEEIHAHEKATGSKLTFKNLLMPAGDLEDADNPREMLLSVMLTRADKKKNTEAAQLSGELSKYHVVTNTPLTNAIRTGIIGKGPQDILIRRKTQTHNELTQYVQLSFDLDGNIIDPSATPTAVDNQEPAGKDAYILSDELRAILKIDGLHTGADDVNREAIYSKIINAENAGRDWRQLQFTAVNIWKEKNHTTKEPSAQAKGAVTKSIEKQRHLFVDIDLKPYEQMKVTFYNPETGRKITEYNDRFLKLARFKEEGGYYFYRLSEYPIELLLAKQLHQLISYPAALLEVHEVDQAGNITEQVIDATESRTAIITNLYRIIYNMKYQLEKAQENARRHNARRLQEISAGKITPESKPEKSAADFLPTPYKKHFRILFETLFEDAGQTSTNREIIRRNREFVFKVLNYIKAYKHRGEPIIKSWSKVEGGRGGAIQGVDIKF